MDKASQEQARPRNRIAMLVVFVALVLVFGFASTSIVTGNAGLLWFLSFFAAAAVVASPYAPGIIGSSVALICAAIMLVSINQITPIFMAMGMTGQNAILLVIFIGIVVSAIIGIVIERTLTKLHI